MPEDPIDANTNKQHGYVAGDQNQQYVIRARIKGKWQPAGYCATVEQFDDFVRDFRGTVPGLTDFQLFDREKDKPVRRARVGKKKGKQRRG